MLKTHHRRRKLTTELGDVISETAREASSAAGGDPEKISSVAGRDLELRARKEAPAASFFRGNQEVCTKHTLFEGSNM